MDIFLRHPRPCEELRLEQGISITGRGQQHTAFKLRLNLVGFVGNAVFKLDLNAEHREDGFINAADLIEESVELHTESSFFDQDTGVLCLLVTGTLYPPRSFE